MTTAYEHPAEHILDEIAWARAVVRGFLAATDRLPDPDAKGLVRAFAMSGEEASRLLVDEAQRPRGPGEADLVRQRIDDRLVASERAGRPMPLFRLIEAFELDDLSRQLLVLALAGEVDESIRRLYMYAWNDLSRRWPTMEFLLGLLQPSAMGRLVNAPAFFRDSALIARRLIELGDGETPTEPFLAREVRLAPSVAAWCIGGEDLDPALAMCARLAAPREGNKPLVMAAEVAAPIAASLERLGRDEVATAVVLIGPAGTGKTTLARQHLGRVLEVDAAALVQPLAGAERRMEVLRRDARLLRVPLVVDLADAEASDQLVGGPYRRLAQLLDEHPHGVVVTARDQASWFVSLLDQAVVHHLPLPSKRERVKLWRGGFAGFNIRNVNPVVLEGAVRYPLSGGAIARAVQAAVARTRSADEPRPVQLGDVTEACRAQLTPRLSGIATRIVTTFTWEDLILPRESREALQEIVAFWKNRRVVFDDWGYGRLLPYGRGLSALFAGPPGTGKTMAAGIVAGELGMEVFRVDLSRTVSKYIGETEKNLGRIFDEASKSQSVLLFDEADSLFAKRTSVQSSIDRYANLEVNYLLQRMEDYDGVTILTTNLEGSLDDAFRRRIKFRVSFPAPDLDTRTELWQRMVPDKARTDEPLNFEIMAFDYDLSGGHIKNAAVRAAFFAAEREGGITMRDLRRAARLECEKLGKIVRVTDDIDELEAVK